MVVWAGKMHVKSKCIFHVEDISYGGYWKEEKKTKTSFLPPRTVVLPTATFARGGLDTEI